MKHCPRCNKDLKESEFTKSLATGKLAVYCRQCMHEYDEARKKKKKIQNKLYREQNKEKLKEYDKNYYRNNKEKCQEYNKSYHKQNREKRLEYSKQYYYKNREKCLELKRKERENNGDEIRARQRKYYAENKKQLTKLREKPMFKLNHAMSNLIYQALKENKNEQHWEELVPYTLQELKEHLENQFDENMNWNNYVEYWEVDHIIPRNQFNYTSCKDRNFQICWSLMNLRPLNWLENRQRPKDGSDISEEQKQQILNQNIGL